MSDINWAPLVIMICLWVVIMSVICIYLWRLDRRMRELHQKARRAMDHGVSLMNKANDTLNGAGGARRCDPKQYRRADERES